MLGSTIFRFFCIPIHSGRPPASPRGPGGLAAGWTTAKLDRPVEAGLHGFWREYQNTFATIERIGLDLDDVLTPFTPSILVSQSGRVALSPVLGENDAKQDEQKDKKSNDDAAFGRITTMDPASLIASRLSELLPPPLDLAFGSCR